MKPRKPIRQLVAGDVIRLAAGREVQVTLAPAATAAPMQENPSWEVWTRCIVTREPVTFTVTGWDATIEFIRNRPIRW